jgi:sortase A
VRGLLWFVQRALVFAAVSMLAYCAFALVESWTYQKEQDKHLQRLLTDRHSAGAPIRAAAYSETSGLVGRLEIPKLDLSAIVMEGDANTVLRHALGHIPGTGLPGLPGNTGISGHRDTFFRPLRNIRLNDAITLTTLLGEFHYRVTSIQIVSPSNVAVLGSTNKETLTLITCYPFYFVGPAPLRFIVRAEREG